MLLESVKAATISVEELLKKINDNTIKTSSIHIEDHLTGLSCLLTDTLPRNLLWRAC